MSLCRSAALLPVQSPPSRTSMFVTRPGATCSASIAAAGAATIRLWPVPLRSCPRVMNLGDARWWRVWCSCWDASVAWCWHRPRIHAWRAGVWLSQLWHRGGLVGTLIHKMSHAKAVHLYLKPLSWLCIVIIMAVNLILAVLAPH